MATKINGQGEPEKHPLPGLTRLQTDSGCCESLLGGVHTSCDSGLGLQFESHGSIASDTARLQCSGVGDATKFQTGGEELEMDFNRMNLRCSGDASRGEDLKSLVQDAPVMQPQGSDVFQQDEDGDTQLHLAIIKPNLEAAQFFIQAAHVPDLLNLQNRKFWHTPLHLAVITNQPQIVRALVMRGASLTRQDHEGNTPVHIACARGQLECLRRLTASVSVQERESVRACNENMNMPLSAMGLHTQQPDFTIRNYDGETCLHVALSCRPPCRLDVIRYLVSECHVDVNMQEGKCGYTLLHGAVRCHDLELIKYLLCQAELDVNLCAYNATNALSIALSLHQAEVCNLLRLRNATEPQSNGQDERESISDSDEEVLDRFEDLVISGQNRNLHYS